MVYRAYVEKKREYAVEAKGVLHEIRHLLLIKSVQDLRIINRYDVEGIDEELFFQCKTTVFSEPQLDDVYTDLDEAVNAQNSDKTPIIFATEYLPGQFDQRADGAAQCIQLISCNERPSVASAKVYALYGDVSDEELTRIKKYVINPVEARQADLAEKTTLKVQYDVPQNVITLTGFITATDEQLCGYIADLGLAMDEADIKFCRDYFKSEGKDPTITEIRMIDTYWSDHCRHTTFGTVLDNVKIDDIAVKNTYDKYIKMRESVHGERIGQKPVCLMDMGTIGAKYLKKAGILKNLDESDEINACSVKIDVDIDGKDEPWLLLFKNETHNHPTEIEPFGGAATCIGGAIRDPLANRGYVYQAMRVTGAGNPLVAVKDTMPGKLPQRKIVQTAAEGYSSYGNQIGLATGCVDEIYHPGYIAKRMEIGAVLGAVAQKAVRREEPDAGDVVVLLGGRTGRDGCGGATGSSKAHKADSLETCGAEVQKGNAPEERKLQRLFRNADATLLIKRCNDFGAGGVSVAIGELADGIDIDLDKVPKKYEGLDGTELAISESQERMAVVVEARHADDFIKLAAKENLQAVVVAVVTDKNRLVMKWRGDVICDIDRNFLNSNGAQKSIDVHVLDMANEDIYDEACGTYGEEQCDKNADLTFEKRLVKLMGNLNICGKKGLAERFDSTIGAGSVLMPFGGKHQLTQTQAMVAKIPVLNAETTTCSAMAWGYNPFIAQKNTYAGAYLAVLESLCKLVATGFERENAYLTFQEYFERLGNKDTRWGKPVASLLGALQAQVDFGVAAIGGKDSMSGSFEELDVPPTLVSFAVAHGNINNVISPEFKAANSEIMLVLPQMGKDNLPEKDSQIAVLDYVSQLIKSGKAVSAATVGMGGAAQWLTNMCFGNAIGFECDSEIDEKQLFFAHYGAFIIELSAGCKAAQVKPQNGTDFTVKRLGKTLESYEFKFNGNTASLKTVQASFEGRLAPVLPYYDDEAQEINCETITFKAENNMSTINKAPHVRTDSACKPRVLIPVFPGTNCEYDSARVMEKAGAIADIFVVKNMSAYDVAQSAKEITQRIKNSEMIFLPGGFSGGDEPEGSAKLIAAFLRNPAVTQEVHDMLFKRDGLMLGICNGFQALIKLGLLPYGKIVDTTPSCPTLTFNTIGRHQSMLVRTRVSSTNSFWLANCNVGDVHTVAISHGEGRFVADESTLVELVKNGQVATQYVDLNGNATMDMRHNPNFSALAIEGITSKDGKIFGKMGHSERCGNALYKNVDGNKMQPIFDAGVNYFK